MNDHQEPQTTADLLNIIRTVSFEVNENIPYRGATVSYFNLQIQLKKLKESIKSYLLLMDNGLCVDAVLIAGHIMETCSIISYITNPTKKEKNTRKYVAKSTLKGIYDLLEYDSSDLKNEDIKAAVFEALDYLSDTGEIVFKKTDAANTTDALPPAEEPSVERSNSSIIQAIKSPELTNTERLKLIKENYDLPIVEDYLKAFLSKLEENLNKTKQLNDPNISKKLKFFYSDYCKIKHSSALIYPGNPKEDCIVLDDNRFKDLSALPVVLCLCSINEILDTNK